MIVYNKQYENKVRTIVIIDQGTTGYICLWQESFGYQRKKTLFVYFVVRDF